MRISLVVTTSRTQQNAEVQITLEFSADPFDCYLIGVESIRLVKPSIRPMDLLWNLMQLESLLKAE